MVEEYALPHIIAIRDIARGITQDYRLIKNDENF
jgi:hypothetical protein